MKISISNIAWDNNLFSYFLEFIKSNGCSGIEIAPSRIWNEPIKSSKTQRLNIVKSINKAGLELVGFHALLYHRPDLQLFLGKESRKATIEYLCDLVDLCSEMGGKQLIFGSPNNRRLHGKNYEECFNQAISDFYEIAEYGKKRNIFFCIEPLGKEYTDFIKSVDEGGKLVSKVNHPFFKLHLDTKTLFSTKENPNQIIKKYGKLIQHVHIGDDNLKEPGSINKGHKMIGVALNEINYSNYLSIEIRKPDKDVKKIISRSILFVKENYKTQ
jgi:sugar phosphate isomerase/epimerase|tara:strand:+ start:2372 stop:3184 length:813 start_codon:yes stop_codon:yes gene_type:complete